MEILNLSDHNWGLIMVELNGGSREKRERRRFKKVEII